MTVDYPATLPVKAVTTLIEIVKSGEILEHKEEFAHACWNIQGFLQRVLLPLPDDIQPVGKAAVADALLELEAALRGTVNVSRGGSGWSLIVILVQLLLDLLGRCRE